MSTGLGEVTTMLKSVTVMVELVLRDRVPLVAVIGREYVPATSATHETVAAPDPVMLDGLIGEQVSPDGVLSVSETVPVNPFSAVIVMVGWAEVPTVTADGDVAEIAKSLTPYTTDVEWDKDPTVPVTVAR